METEGTSPGDLGRAVTDGYVAAPVPLLVVASLAGGVLVDATTVSYLLKVASAEDGRGGEEGEGEAGA